MKQRYKRNAKGVAVLSYVQDAVIDTSNDVNLVNYEQRMGRVADALNTHIRADLRDHVYFDRKIDENKIIPNRIIAYGKITYKSFAQRVAEAKEIVQTLTTKTI